MARVSKSSSASVSAPVVAATPTPVSAPVKEAKVPKAAKVKTEVVVVVDTAPVVDVVVAEEKVSTTRKLADEVAAFNANLSVLTASLAKAKSSSVVIAKLSARLSKEEEKRSSKRKGIRTNGTTGGFNKLTSISDDLATFFGLESGARMSRKEVSSKIHIYAIDHNLRNPEDKRIITPDDKLCKLFGVTADYRGLSYFTLQTHLKPHYL